MKPISMGDNEALKSWQSERGKPEAPHVTTTASGGGEAGQIALGPDGCYAVY